MDNKERFKLTYSTTYGKAKMQEHTILRLKKPKMQTAMEFIL